MWAQKLAPCGGVGHGEQGGAIGRGGGGATDVRWHCGVRDQRCDPYFLDDEGVHINVFHQ